MFFVLQPKASGTTSYYCYNYRPTIRTNLMVNIVTSVGAHRLLVLQRYIAVTWDCAPDDTATVARLSIGTCIDLRYIHVLFVRTWIRVRNARSRLRAAVWRTVTSLRRFLRNICVISTWRQQQQQHKKDGLHSSNRIRDTRYEITEFRSVAHGRRILILETYQTVIMSARHSTVEHHQ